jgi:hypothetical protein
MSSVTSIPASAVTPEELNSILADYLALYEARVFRQLLVSRLSVVACAIALTGIFVDRLSHSFWWISLVLCLAPAVGAWLVERRIQYRLAVRLDGVPGTNGGVAAGDGEVVCGVKKVIKSS